LKSAETPAKYISISAAHCSTAVEAMPALPKADLREQAALE
jgi:hypothetical protein